MRRLATILLLGLLLFNWIGYRLYTSYVENRYNRELEAQIDDNKYDPTQLVSIKVPISHLAYYNTSNQFERVDGQIETGGVVYEYVKRRLYNDSLEVLCIPNNAATQLKVAKNEFFRLVNDLQTNASSKKTNTHKELGKSFSSDNYTLNESWLLNNFRFAGPKPSARYSENPVSFYSSTDEQPPDLLS